MKTLVTGASGFLGGWLTRRLIDEGHQVSILARKSADLSDLADLPIERRMGDVTDLGSLVDAVRGVDVIFHLAGLIAYAPKDRAAMEKVNVGGTQNVVQAMVKNKVSKLLHVSSVVTIGASFDDRSILNEESSYDIGHLNLGYFETKRRAEQLVIEATRSGDIEAIVVNPATIYGSGDAKKGSRHTQLKVARGKFPVYSDGGVNVVPLSSAIDGILLAIAKGRPGERYILSGQNFRIKELFDIIAERAKVKPPGIYLPSKIVRAIGRTGDFLEKIGIHAPMNSESAWTSTLFHWFDNSKAKRDLGFNPGDSTKAIQSSVDWMKSHGYLSSEK